MSANSSPRPKPWQHLGVRNPDLARGIGPLLKETPFPVQGMPQPMTRLPAALVALLGELGETDLPDPRSPGLVDPYTPAPRTR